MNTLFLQQTFKIRIALRTLVFSAALLLLTFSVLAQHDHDEHGEHEHSEEQHNDSDRDQHDDDEHEHDDHEHEENEGRVEIDAKIAAQANIVAYVASQQALHQRVPLFGKTITDPQQISHIRARYPGVIKQVNVSMGDHVTASDALLRVEANNSLQTYTITSPIDGIVIQRHANPGEVTGDNELLTIANYQRLWVELNVFPAQASQIKAGQSLRIVAGDRVADTEIRYLTPTEHGGPSILARAQLDNSDNHWTPDLMVEGAVSVAEFTVAVAVDNRALQQFENRTVVFVQQGNTYKARPLQLGRDDDVFTEVLDGLRAGELYVVENSFLIKADLEKAGAAHHH